MANHDSRMVKRYMVYGLVDLTYLSVSRESGNDSVRPIGSRNGGAREMRAHTNAANLDLIR